MAGLEMRGFEWSALNTTITVFAPWTDFEIRRGAPVWQQMVVNYVDTFEQKASRFRSDSELNQLNELTVGQSRVASQTIDELLTDSLRMQAQTGGLFNPFLGKKLNQLGYDQSFEKLRSAPRPNPQDVQPNQQNDIWPAFERVNSHPRQWRRVTDGHLDFGGIGKGWLADRLKTLLQEMWGVAYGMVDAGGDLVVWGIPEHMQPLCMEIQDPWNEELVIAEFDLREGAVATSNTLFRAWTDANGQQQHHILHPASGRPADSGIVQATVLAADATVADVYAKCLCLLAVDEISEWIDGHKEIQQAWVVNRAKQMFSYTNQAMMR